MRGPLFTLFCVQDGDLQGNLLLLARKFISKTLLKRSYCAHVFSFSPFMVLHRFFVHGEKSVELQSPNLLIFSNCYPTLKCLIGGQSIFPHRYLSASSHHICISSALCLVSLNSSKSKEQQANHSILSFLRRKP